MSTLYIIATPIGNLSDISLRALDILKQVDFIACEDTRHTQKLLSHFNINKRCISYHEHNENQCAFKIISLCKEGQSVALVSDAGTPLISDPGFFLIKMAIEAGIKISPIPGACAAIAALSVSGLPCDKFIFEGFLPIKSSSRVNRLNALAEETRTLIFYEAPHRIIEMLKDLALVLGEKREACIARELTKTFETIHKTSLGDLLIWLESDVHQTKGEFVIMVSGIDKDSLEIHQQKKAEILLFELLKHLPLKKAVQLTTSLTGTSKNDIYALAIEHQKNIQI